MKTLLVSVRSGQTLILRMLTPQNLDSQLQTITSVSISDPSQASTSSDNLLAYRPNYTNAHNSSLGVVFLNLNGIFPCIPRATRYLPCGLVSVEEDGSFFGGRSKLQTADRGNNIKVFSSTEQLYTHGLAIEGCPQLTSSCWPTNADVGVTYQLPRQYCGD